MEMDRTLTNLSRMLSELDPGFGIESPEQRAIGQKTVYLAQAIGIHLHYPFRLRNTGPFSPDLAHDQYALQERPPQETREIADQTLREPFASALEKIKQLTEVPEKVNLNRREWLEILACVHYLRRSKGRDAAATKSWLDAGKPDLSAHTQAATRALTAQGML